MSHLLFILFFFLLQIFVGNLDPNVTEEELKQTFLQFGEIVYVKTPVGKGCGFVQFGTRFVNCLCVKPLLDCSYNLDVGCKNFSIISFC